MREHDPLVGPGAVVGGAVDEGAAVVDGHALQPVLEVLLGEVPPDRIEVLPRNYVFLKRNIFFTLVTPFLFCERYTCLVATHVSWL